MDMTSNKALIIGGSRGCGLALAGRLADTGTNVTIVARNSGGLDAASRQISGLNTIAADARDDGFAAQLIRETTPDLLVLAGGHEPRLASFAEMNWDEFSAPWNSDMKIAHGFMAAALNTPMAPGSRIVSFSSGAALNGSPLSGGYAGAKRMQHYLANYAQRESDMRGMDLTFSTIIPAQLMAGSSIGAAAAAAYGAVSGGSAENFMAQWEKPLTAELVADSIMHHLASDEPAGAYLVTGDGMSPLP